MIAEALEAAWLVASALAVWIVIGAVVVTAGVLGTVAGVWAVCRILRRAWATVAARRPQEPAGAPQGASRDSRSIRTTGTASRRALSLSPPQNPSNRSKI